MGTSRRLVDVDSLCSLPPADRVAAARRFIAQNLEDNHRARLCRNEAIRALCAEVLSNGKPRGPAETARLLGMKQQTVKGINTGGSGG